MNSNLPANKPENRRERFASPLSVTLLIGAGILLLVMLYPEKDLLRLLSVSSVTSPAQQRYLEILVHLRPGDAGLAITLARSYLAADLPERVDHVLDHLRGQFSPQQSKSVMMVRYEAQRRILNRLKADDVHRVEAQHIYNARLEALMQSGATTAELYGYLADAKKIKDLAVISRLEALLKQRAESNSVTPAVNGQPPVTAAAALARGDYRGAAAIHFQDMKKASGNMKRNCFLAGVHTLQSGNLLDEALAEAEKNLGSLANDRTTLMNLSRLALAADKPELAQRYIRKALGIVDSGAGGT